MKKELFDELLKSVEQGGEIMKRTMKPARTFPFILEKACSRVGDLIKKIRGTPFGEPLRAARMRQLLCAPSVV